MPTPEPHLTSVAAGCPGPGINPINPAAPPPPCLGDQSEVTSFSLLGPCFLEAVAACFGRCFKLIPQGT